MSKRCLNDLQRMQNVFGLCHFFQFVSRALGQFVSVWRRLKVLLLCIYSYHLVKSNSWVLENDQGDAFLFRIWNLFFNVFEIHVAKWIYSRLIHLSPTSWSSGSGSAFTWQLPHPPPIYIPLVAQELGTLHYVISSFPTAYANLSDLFL